LSGVSTQRDPDRLVLFTDAVVAIAITLLILPLVDVGTEAVAENLGTRAVISDHKTQIVSFLLSFVVIARLWLTHHRIFEHVKAYNSRLMELNMFWLLTIVILPFPTVMISGSDDRFTAPLYIGTILASSIGQSALTLLVRGNPQLESDENPITSQYVVSTVTATVLFAVAFALAALVPGVNYYALFLLLLGPTVTRIWGKYRAKSRQGAQ
jgi:uncharacterized membrane protein